MVIPYLIDITIEDITKGLDNGDFTSVDLVEAYHRRCSEVDETFNAVIEFNEDAWSLAEKLDEERNISGRRGPLHGVPIMLKDNIHTNDNMYTTAGSYALWEAETHFEATVATRLREAGVILLGKTNMSEWANFRSKKSSNGWSARGKQTYGPYCEKMDPSGSSSGSGVATALGLCLAAIGTETDGSITCPAEKSAVVGVKPTVGLVPRDGVIPISDYQDTVGPMARTVKDAAYILTAIAGRSALDDRTMAIPFSPIPNYSGFCQAGDLRDIRIGVPSNPLIFGKIDSQAAASFDLAINVLARDAKATIIYHTDYLCMEEWDSWDKDERMSVLEADFKTAIEKYCRSLKTNPNKINSVEDIIAFTKMTPTEEYPARDIDRWTSSLKSASMTPEELERRRTKMLRCSKEEGILGVLDAYNLDAIIAPTTEGPHITFAARAGLPIVTVPMGFYSRDTEIEMNKRGDLVNKGPNVPYCICFVGRAFSEQTLIRIAHAFEQLTDIRLMVEPFAKPQTELSNVLYEKTTKGGKTPKNSEMLPSSA